MSAKDVKKQSGRLKKLAKKYHLSLILLFGSRASGQTHKNSDFDIAYLSDNGLDLGQEAKLIVELFPFFRSENIDLANLRNAPPLLFFAIFNDCQVLYEKKPLLFASLRAYAFKKYIETKPLYEEKFARLEKKIAKITIES